MYALTLRNILKIVTENQWKSTCDIRSNEKLKSRQPMWFSMRNKSIVFTYMLQDDDVCNVKAAC